jgi:hypothetical protein
MNPMPLSTALQVKPLDGMKKKVSKANQCLGINML